MILNAGNFFRPHRGSKYNDWVWRIKIAGLPPLSAAPCEVEPIFEAVAPNDGGIAYWDPRFAVAFDNQSLDIDKKKKLNIKKRDEK